MSARGEWQRVELNGRSYKVEIRDGQVANIYGSRELIVPSTAHLAPAYHQYTSVRTDIDPDGRLGRKIVRALAAAKIAA